MHDLQPARSLLALVEEQAFSDDPELQELRRLQQQLDERLTKYQADREAKAEAKKDTRDDTGEKRQPPEGKLEGDDFMCIDEEALNSLVTEFMGQFSATQNSAASIDSDSKDEAAEACKNKFEQMLRRQTASTAAAAAQKQRITSGPYSWGG